jgi:hypothetical protein
VARCLTWLRAILATGAAVVIPDIVHYELRRELLRIRALGSLRRLDYALDSSSGLDHFVVTTDAIIKAAEFWAFQRQSGIPTASPDALNADAILAGQAALVGQPGDTAAIETTNLAHLRMSQARRDRSARSTPRSAALERDESARRPQSHGNQDH